jgi:fatty-acyl-CoA synthase
MADFTFSELTPTDFLRRSALVHPDRLAIVDGDLRFSYREFWERSLALTGLLGAAGVGPGDRVAALCTNSHVMLELHHGAPLRQAVLVPLNIRLSEDELAYIIEHSGSTLLVVTEEFGAVGAALATRTGVRLITAGPKGDYERLLAAAEPAPLACTDERGLLGVNYTSGTTGTPKGVMTHHRGAYLQCFALMVHLRMDPTSTYLWTLPMFHCNGWCLTWGVTAVAGTHVCLRSIDPERIWQLMRTEGVTHFSAAPTVLTMIASAQGAASSKLESRVTVQTGGSPPSPSLLARLHQLGLDVTHLYGLTETFGPLAINEWKQEWDVLPSDKQSALRARQGVANAVAQPLRVVASDGNDVLADGATLGEIVVRGNDVMLGYYRDLDATEAVTLEDSFRTGDLAVMHPDGYVEIRDRAKDVIISGGENIASVEVERALDSHPDVLESAVVGMPDEKWGEVPVAFVALRPDASLTTDQLVAHVREQLAGFKVPRRVYFTDLPKTSTGKIQKHKLRGISTQATA